MIEKKNVTRSKVIKSHTLYNPTTLCTETLQNIILKTDSCVHTCEALSD